MKPAKLISILFFTLCLVFWCTGAPVSAQSKLDVSGDIYTPGLGLKAKDSAPVPAGPEGQVYYNGTSDNVYISNGAAWRDIALPMNVASVIVAASDSLDASRADYACDGNEDEEEINLAISDISASGGAVYLLEGTYNISGPINIAADNISLIGTGAGTVLTKASLTEFSVIYASSASKILISRLQINGSQTAGCGIDFSNVSYSKIDKIWLKGLNENTNIKAGVWLGSSNYNIISGVNITGFDFAPGPKAANGIELASGDAGSSNNIVCGNYISECNRISLFVGSLSQNNIICDNVIINAIGQAGDSAVMIVGDNNVLRDNIIDNNAYRGVFLGGDYCLISGNSITNNYEEGIFLGDTGASYGSAVPAYAVISNNTITGNRREGITINKSDSGSVISANVIYDNGQSNARDGICIGGGVSGDNLISGNLIYDSSGTGDGIEIYSNSNDNNYLASNFITGAGFSSKIKDNGTNTKYTGADKITFEPITVDITGSGQTVYPAGKASGSPVYPPASYIILNNVSGSDQDIVLGNGQSPGDLLILKCKDLSLIDPVTIKNGGNVDIGADEVLANDDVFELIWNGTQWLGLSG
ncbi:MAG: hypothetical protein COV72_07720 [Candidatus Omnitrophica bacterium CG11_big_fil_rev_8_21_14_0_20_42_13]|uniref:Right handed beta helix domain-containing protein n=1 Tax=Candidatus Ghiorseimicrobium undicola TaxID=1974746 RepID=A0A2H0LVT4_9BACT|nr:MAG: hypothetical protein COV72_07720 [Candidatus Omnitrophica bacterium CG11_big_fil_rev_8_21_14_0_20_42_13]